jgi:UDP:flavonoid glycosyltransferase YjiC (YdhE family)
VIHPTLDFSGPLTAHVLGVPAVSLAPGLPIADAALAAAHDELTGLHARWGYEPDQASAAMCLRTWPPSLLGPARSAPGQSMRYVPYNGPETIPARLLGPVPAVRACVTLGSVLPGTDGLEVLPTVIAALCEVADELLVVLPQEAAAALSDLMPLPPRVHLADAAAGPWLALNLALAGCSLLVHHGGAGTAQTAFSMGVPQVVIPRMADQFAIAATVVGSGTGRALLPSELTRESLQAAVTDVLTDIAYRRAADAIRREIAGQPHPAQIVAMIENLVGDPRPHAGASPCE